MNNDTKKATASQQAGKPGEGEPLFKGATIEDFPAWVNMPGPWAHIEASWDKVPKKRRCN